MTNDDRRGDAGDDTIREALASTGDRPTPELVASLRATLTDAVAGRTTAQISAGEPSSRRWLPLIAAAAAIVLVVTIAAAVLTRGDDGELATTPPETIDDVFDALVDRTWIVLERSGRPVGAGEHATIRFSRHDGRYRVGGFDGCNWWDAPIAVELNEPGLAISSIEDGSFSETAQECIPAPPRSFSFGTVELPAPGRLVIRGAAGEFAYVDLDGVDGAHPITPADLVETWRAPDAPATRLVGTRLGGPALDIAGCRTAISVPEPGQLLIAHAPDPCRPTCRTADIASSLFLDNSGPGPEPAPVRATVFEHRLFLIHGPAGTEVSRLDRVTDENDDVGCVPSLEDELYDRTWVAVSGAMREQAPAVRFQFGSLADWEGTGITARAVFGGCEVTFELDGSLIVDPRVTNERPDEPCDAAQLLQNETSLSVDDALLTVTSHREDRAPTTYVALDALDAEDSPDLSGAWFANDVPVVIDGRSVVALDDEPIASDVRFVLSGGSFDAFRYRDGWIIHPDGRVALGGPFVGWVGHQLWGFIVLTPNDPSVLDPHGQQLVDQLVGRTWVGVDGPWRTTSPTLLFDSLDREPGLLGMVVDNGCNRGDGTFRLAGDRLVASEIAIEEARCDHEVAYLVDGTTLTVDDGVLTVTSTSGPTITTTYVALDSLDAVRSPDLTGDWSANGIPITIAGTEVTAAPDAPAEVVVALRNALDDASLEAFRRDDGWIVRSASGTVQLEPS